MGSTNLQAVFEAAYFPPSGTPWPPLRWRGVPCQQLATDLWALGQLVWDVRPGLVIETGTAAGGTTLFLADLCDQVGLGSVWTVDVQPCGRIHPRVDWQVGDATADATLRSARRGAAWCVRQGLPVLVLLDSDHRAAHVAAELAAYAPLVTVGSYLVVEDTNLGATVMPEHGPGPAVAIRDYLAQHPGEWAVAHDVEPPITHAPGGWLRRVAACAHGGA